MLVEVKAMKEFERPIDGIHDAVLVDVINLGEKITQYGPKTKVQYIWLLTGLDSEKKNFQVQKQMNMTMFKGSKPGQKNSQMFDTSKAILGDEPQLKPNFETEVLVGKNNQLVIENQLAANGKTYANVIAIMKPKVAFPAPAGYVRKSLQPTTQAQTAASASAQPSVPTTTTQDVEDLPF